MRLLSFRASSVKGLELGQTCFAAVKMMMSYVLLLLFVNDDVPDLWAVLAFPHWNKTNLVMVYSIPNVLLNFVWKLFRIFNISVHQRIWFIISRGRWIFVSSRLGLSTK